MLKSKKVNLVIFFIVFIVIFSFSCSKLDHYEAPVYLKIIKTADVNPGGQETSGTDIYRWYKGTTYYPMKALLHLEAISVYEPALDSMKPKGVTLNKIIMKYYAGENPDLSATPNITVTKSVSFFVPVTEGEEEEEETGVKFYLVVGDEESLFPNGIGAAPRDNYFWTLKCELYAVDERGNLVTGEVYLFLNCNLRLYEEKT